MARVKFNVSTEYAYLQNFKILQSTVPYTLYQNINLTDFGNADTFTRHSIERSVPVEALIKCKMQDNLEFLQWTKRFWDQYFPGGEYDAISRRKASGSASSVTPAASSRTSGASAARRGVTPTGGTAKSNRAMGGGPGSAALANENAQLKETVTGLERERLLFQQAQRH